MILMAGLLALSHATAQERLDRKEALKYAFFLSYDLPALRGTPIPTDVDVKQPVGLRHQQYVALVLPEAKLQLAAIQHAGESPVPVGQLWLNGLAPMQDGHGAARGDLRAVEVKTERGDGVEVFQCALAVKSAGNGGLSLLVYGKSKTPLLEAPLKKIQVSQDDPIDLSAVSGDESGTITLKLLGQYEAAIKVTEPGY